jgi:hypothetical protein
MAKIPDGRIALVALIALAAWLFIGLPLLYLPNEGHVHGEILGVKYGEWLLFAATMGLWWATWRLVRSAEKTAERQLRAYIVAGANGVNINGPQNSVSVSMQIVIKNTGQTPAHDLTVVSKTELLEHPIKMPFNFTLISGPDPSRSVLGAGETTASESKSEKPFNGDEMMVAAEPEAGARIYTWGSVTYRDVFGHQHHTNFCSSLIFDGSEAIAHASEHHNDAS